MPDETYILIAALLVMIIGGVLTWAVFREMAKVTGQTYRASTREREQYFNAIERLTEKLTSPRPLETSYQHAQERVGQIRAEAEIEKAAVAQDKQNLAQEFAGHVHESQFEAGSNDLDIQGGDGYPA